MNYTAAVSGGWIILCLLYFYCPKYGGKYWFKGPVNNIALDGGETDSIGGSASMEDEKKLQA